MSRRTSNLPVSVSHDDELDEFDDFLASQNEDPKFSASYEDAAIRARIVRSLIECRKAQGITQQMIADHMEIRQSVVSQFENAGDDVFLSTLQRYARAVGARLRLRFELPADQAWSSLAGRRSYRAPTSSRPEGGATTVSAPDSPWLATWVTEVARSQEEARAS